MKNNTIVFLLVLAIFAGCGQSESEKGWSETTKGVQFKMLTKGSGAQIKLGDVVTFHLSEGTESNNVMYESFSKKPLVYPVTNPMNYADIMERLLVLHVGDSASFRLSADSVFKTAMPQNIKPGEMIVSTIKVLSVMSQAEFDSIEKAKELAKINEQLSHIMNHLSENNITDYTKSEDGVIYTITREGRGDFPVSGQKVKVHYTGKLLDGTVFDSSVERGTPYEFIVDQSSVIKGWHKGIPLFRVGSKGTIYLPPSLGYGSQDRGKIPPNSSLIFEIEVLEIVKSEADVLKDYLQSNNINANRSADGIYYVVHKEGTGPKPMPGQRVTVHYTGMLLNGKKFDSSVDRGMPFEFNIGKGEVIQGWDKGIPLFNVGSKGTLYLTSDLGYGQRGFPPNIPPSSTLIFDIEVLGTK